MNKIPKCSKKMIPMIKTKTKKSNNQLNYNKIKISVTKSFGNDITNIIKNKEIKISKKSSSYNEKVSKKT